MNKSKLYIHIGTQKTGSTAIQNTLEKNKAHLAKEGIFYLGRYAVLARKLRASRKVDPDLVQTFREILKRDIREKEKQSPVPSCFVISNEKFSGDKMTGYENAGVVAKSLREVTEGLDMKVQIIVYLRRQDDFFEATYAQRIFSGDSCTFDQFLKQFDKSGFHWDTLLESYAGVFGREQITPRRYGKAFLPEKDSLLQDFGSVLDSRWLGNFTDTQIRNPGFSRDTLELTRLINPYLDKQERREIRTILKSIDSKQPFERYSFFEPGQRKNFLSRFEKSNAVVAKTYFDESSGRLFPAPDSGETFKPYSGLTPESVAVNLTKAVAILNNRLLALEQEVEKIKKKTSLKKKLVRRAGALLSPFPGLKYRLRLWTGDRRGK